MNPTRFSLNGRSVQLDSDQGGTLLRALRMELALTGTKYGCGEGLCGACTVLVDGKAVRSCVTPLRQVTGKHVVTIEGLARAGALHPLQQAFIEQGAVQCGYCTPGMLLSAFALLQANPRPSRAEIVAHMERNLCRCGTYRRIIAAIEAAGRQLEGRS